MELALKIGLAIVFAMMIWRMYPMAKEWLANGPKGSSKEWLNFVLIILAVVAFVVFLIASVRG